MKKIAVVIVFAAVCCTPVMAHGPHHHGNDGIHLATDIVNLVNSVFGRNTTVVVSRPAPPPVLVAPAPVAVAPAPPPPPRPVFYRHPGPRPEHHAPGHRNPPPKHHGSGHRR